MKQFILMCVNEEKDVVGTQVFATLKEAQKQMREDYEYELEDAGKPLYDRHGEFFEYENVEDSSIKERWAHIYFKSSDYDDSLEYHWEIHEQDVPTPIAVSILNEVCNSLINVSLLNEAQFGAIFNEPGKPDFSYLASRFHSSDFHSFYNSLDEGNRMKLVAYLLQSSSE